MRCSRRVVTPVGTGPRATTQWPRGVSEAMTDTAKTTAAPARASGAEGAPAPGGADRLGLRRPVRRQGAQAVGRGRHAGREDHPPPVPAAALPDRDRHPVRGRDRAVDPRGAGERQKNATVLLGEVTDIDLEAQTVTSHVLGRETVTPYDSLIVAAGSEPVLLRARRVRRVRPGHEEHRRRARAARPDLRCLRARRAGAMRGENVDALLTFVVVGAGPTGVEMAGQIAELSPPYPQARLPRHQLARGPRHPRRRCRPGAAAVRRPARGARPSVPWRSSVSRCGSGPWSPTSTRAASR